jgi:Flp pilus assembly protein TadG
MMQMGGTIMKMIQFLAGLKRRFKANEGGATAVTFALMAVPLIALAGGAVDYAKTLRVKSELMATLDAAVLAATQAYALDDSVDTAKIVRDFIDKNYTKSGKRLFSSDLVVHDPVISEDGELKVNLDVRVPNHLLTVIGFDSFDFTIGSAARVGGRKLEVALVLDNTKSMTWNAKLEALKSSAHLLVDKLMVDGKDNVKVALVPYADYVNIGMANRFEPGLDIPADYTVRWTPEGEHCWNEYPDSTRQCTPVKEWTTCYDDGVPYQCEKTVDWECTGELGDPVRHCEPWTEQARDYKWFGCMASRPHDLNVRDEDYATGVPGVMTTYDKCSSISQMIRLSSNKSAINSAIDAMKGDRNTYIPAGLAWGWRALSDHAPFADGVPYDNEDVTKVIILMTDGDNTLAMRKWSNRSAIHHAGEVWGHDVDTRKKPAFQPQVDGYTAEICENIKKKGIVIHTIAFDVAAGSPVENLMRNCAGNGGQYYDADDSAELADAFNKIALALLNLRLSR